MIKIREVEIEISRCEDEYFIEAYKNDELVAIFELDAPLEGLDLIEAIDEEIKKLNFNN